jgi:hypothetical protein
LTDLIDRWLTENRLKFADRNTITYVRAASPLGEIHIMLSYPFEPEEDDFLGQLDLEDIYPEETFGDRLRLFYAQFSSGTRSLLSDSLFREIQNADGVIQGLEILCPNEIIQRRLLQKQQKICSEVHWIWPDSMSRIEMWVSRSPATRKVLALRSQSNKS